MLDEWISAVKDELGIDLDVDTGVLLDLARDAAHGVARPAAPLTTFLVGYAAARAGGGPEAVAEAARKAAALALRWADEEAPTPPTPSRSGSRSRIRRGFRRPAGRRMTAARGTRDSRPADDLDDLDVEEALALVKEGSARASGEPGPGDSAARDRSGTPSTPVPTAQGEPHAHTADSGHGDHARRPRRSPQRPRRPPQGHPLAQARTTAERAARSVPRPTPVSVPLDASLGLVIAAPLTALTDLPSFDTSAMDGWAVAGPGPWDVREEGVLAGHAQPEALTDGEAVRIATGARVPQDATAVLRSEHGRIDDKGRLHAALPQASGSAEQGRSPTSCTARTSARAARSAAAATSSCRSARWSRPPCWASPRPPGTTRSPSSPGRASKSSCSATSCSPRGCPRRA